MKLRWCVLTFLLGLLLPRLSGAATQNVARFALVIGNNRPEGTKTSTLRYADDDAVATHRLLLQAGVDSVLLVTLDSDSQKLYPTLKPRGAPRSQDLAQAFAALSARIRQAAQRGRDTELLLFYSGHGDVERGEGYVVLEDGHLTRSKLYSLLAGSPATRNHVFVDACKSYFLAFEKGSGGRRVDYDRALAAEVPARLANTGFVLSTSSDRDSHEWERYQAGIISHELRSALRGAADANNDGRVTYGELGAFLTTANRSIPNARFRPEFTIRPPAHDLQQSVLAWRQDPTALTLDGPTVGHIYVETATGDRVLDAHPAGTQALTLHVPDERPLFVRRDDESAEVIVTDRQPKRVTMLDARRPAEARKGAIFLAFEQLFASPFDAGDVARFERTEGLRGPLTGAGAAPWSRRTTLGTVAGAVGLGAGAGALTLGILSAERYFGGSSAASQQDIESRNRSGSDLKMGSLVLLGVAAAAGLTWGYTRLSSDTSVSIESIARGQGKERGAQLRIAGKF